MVPAVQDLPGRTFSGGPGRRDRPQAVRPQLRGRGGLHCGNSPCGNAARPQALQAGRPEAAGLGTRASSQERRPSGGPLDPQPLHCLESRGPLAAGLWSSSFGLRRGQHCPPRPSLVAGSGCGWPERLSLDRGLVTMQVTGPSPGISKPGGLGGSENPHPQVRPVLLAQGPHSERAPPLRLPSGLVPVKMTTATALCQGLC